MLTQLVALALLFFAITPNLGFFTIPSILLITSVLFLMLIEESYPKMFGSIKVTELVNIIPYAFFTLLFYGVIYYGGLYQNTNSIIVGYFVLGAFIFINFLRYLLFKKTFSFLFICTIYLLMSFWTLLNSPHPTVDTVIVLKEAPLMLLSGKNPYSSTFTQVYKDIKPNYYNYLPFSFFYALPFVLVFHDPRFLIIFSNLLSALIIYKLFNKEDKDKIINIFVLTFLFLPRSFYMLEHAYLDPVIFSFFLLFLYFFISKNKSQFSYLFLGLFFSIKQPPILVLPLLLKEKNILKGFFKIPNLILFLLPFSLPVFYLLINSKAFIENIFTGLNPSKITSPISESLTLPTLLKYFSLPANIAYLIGLIMLLVTFVYIFITKKSLIFKIALFFLSFNYFTYHAFFNSYFLVIEFLLLGLAIQYFWNTNKQNHSLN